MWSHRIFATPENFAEPTEFMYLCSQKSHAPLRLRAAVGVVARGSAHGYFAEAIAVERNKYPPA
jgi:hypothetical protein